MPTTLRRPTPRLAAVCVVMALFALVAATVTESASAPAGVFDPTFGSNGIVRRNVEGTAVSTDQLDAIVTLPNGRVLGAGAGGNPYADTLLFQVLPDGSPDPAFGVNGLARHAFSDFHQSVVAMARRPDGRIVLGLTLHHARSADTFGVAQLLPDGSRDPSFGTNGLAIVQTAGTEFINSGDGLALQPDGRIVVLAQSFIDDTRTVVVRLLADGAIDPSFGTAGAAVVAGATSEIAAQPDGRIVLAGTTSSWMTVMRLEADGALDPSFGTGGRVELLGHPNGDRTEALVLQPDGRIVVGGSGSTGAAGRFTVARVLPDGRLDTSFGNNAGFSDATVAFGVDVVRALAVQPDGKLVATGGTSSIAGGYQWLVARYRADGQLDHTFGGNGVVVFGPSAYGSGLAVAVNADGAFVTGTEGTSGDLLIVKLGTGDTAPPQTTTTTSTTGPPATTTPPPPTGSPGARFVAVPAVRVLDTRPTHAPVPAGGTATVSLTSPPVVPARAVAAVVNVTATDATDAGYVTVWGSGTPRPNVSTLNLPARAGTVANLATVPLDATGSLSLFTEAGGHLIVDVVGYYEPVATAVTEGRFRAVTPVRALDTRGLGAAPAIVDLDTRAIAGVPAVGVSAVIVNIAAVDSVDAGFVTAWPRSAGARPGTSNLNVDAAHQTRANQAIVPVGTDGVVRFATETGAHLLVDVVGYLTDATAPASTSGLFRPIAPSRVLDTRLGLGAPNGPVRAGQTLDLGLAGAVPADAQAVIGSVTATGSAGAGFVTVWPRSSAPRPEVSSVNLDAVAQTRANHIVMPLGDAAALRAYADTGLHLLLDITGVFTS